MMTGDSVFQEGRPTPTSFSNSVTGALKTCLAMQSMCSEASPTAWRAVLLPVWTERSVKVIFDPLFIIPRILLCDFFSFPPTHPTSALATQGTGRYSIYVANYASGNVGPHALLEMDEAASDVSQGIVVLSDVAAQVGVNKLTGEKLL